MPVGSSLLLPAACLPVLLHGRPSSKGAAERAGPRLRALMALLPYSTALL